MKMPKETMEKVRAALELALRRSEYHHGDTADYTAALRLLDETADELEPQRFVGVDYAREAGDHSARVYCHKDENGVIVVDKIETWAHGQTDPLVQRLSDGIASLAAPKPKDEGKCPVEGCEDGTLTVDSDIRFPRDCNAVLNISRCPWPVHKGKP